LKDSNTCLEGQCGKRGRLRCLLAGLALACFSGPADALDPNRTISQYIHDEWGPARGLRTGTIYAIAQSADGYLWIGAERGLVRFDGLSFRTFTHTDSPTLPPGPILGLIADHQGNLWIRPQGPSVVRYRDGMFQDLAVIPGQTEYSMTAMGQGSNGELLLAYRNASVRYSHGKLIPILIGPEPPFVISMAQTQDGKFWLGTRDAGLCSVSEGRLSAAGPEIHDRKINELLAAGDRELWIGTDNGVVRWDGTAITQSSVPASLAHVRTLALIKDRDSNIWAGTASGLVRIRSGDSQADQLARPGQEVTALFEDRDGDLWVGSGPGLERFRDSVFITYPPPVGHAEGNGPLYVDAGQRTWFGPPDGGLYLLQNGKMERVAIAGLDRDVVYSIAGGPGALWIARQRGGLTCLRFEGAARTSRTYTKADGLAQDSVYAVYRSRDGSVWAGTVNGGVSRFHDGKFTTYTAADGLASNTVSAIEETPDGTIWLATPNGLSAFKGGRWSVLSGAEGLPPGGVNCLAADSAGVLWIGTSKGLGFLRAGRVEFPLETPEALREEIFGIAEDRSGWLWIATSDHVLRVKRDQVLNGSVHAGDVREFGMADGLPGTESAKRFRSVTSDALKRVWLSLNGGIAVADPARLAHPAVPVLVHIENISADGRLVDKSGPIRIPPGLRRLTIEYAGLSLSAPERVRFRYKLDPYDRGWSAPAAAREAAYTNLEPRSYRFRVIASNSDGVWDSAEAVASFEIEPALHETWWFRLSIVLGGALSVLLLYQFRVYQVTRQLNMRFEERLAERTRIAQELHDTLLQGFLSASMQLNVAVDGLPPDSVFGC
jgi:ligand-binding sensor domain-containing protein